MRTRPPTARDQRSTDRAFRQLTRQLRGPAPATRTWRGGPTDGRDVRITPHGDRRSVPTAGVAAGAFVLALAGILTADVRLAVAVAIVGSVAAAFLGSDQARTHLTITHDGRVEVGNGVLRRLTSVPAIAVARIAVPTRRSSRWDPRRSPGHLHLHNGDVITVRALAFDPSREVDQDRAVWLGRSAVRALEHAGAVLGTRKV